MVGRDDALTRDAIHRAGAAIMDAIERCAAPVDEDGDPIDPETDTHTITSADGDPAVQAKQGVPA
jgi:hypothetical protein